MSESQILVFNKGYIFSFFGFLKLAVWILLGILCGLMHTCYIYMESTEPSGSYTSDSKRIILDNYFLNFSYRWNMVTWIVIS